MLRSCLTGLLITSCVWAADPPAPANQSAPAPAWLGVGLEEVGDALA